MKHFHGRRHIRAQKTVRIGRERKRRRRQDNWLRFVISFHAVYENAVLTLNSAIENISKRIVEIASDFENGTGDEQPIGFVRTSDIKS